MAKAKAKKAKPKAKAKKAKPSTTSSEAKVVETPKAPEVPKFDYTDQNPQPGQKCVWEGLDGYCHHILYDENGNPTDAVFVSYSNFGETKRAVPYTDLTTKVDE